VYHKNVNLYQKQIIAYTNNIKKIEQILTDSLIHIKINSSDIKKNIEKNKLQEQQISNSKQIYSEIQKNHRYLRGVLIN